MRSFELKTVDQNPEVIRIKGVIENYKKSIGSYERDRDELVKKSQKSIDAYREGLVRKELGEITQGQLDTLLEDTKTQQFALQKYEQDNNSEIENARIQALNKLQNELETAEAIALDEIDSEIEDYVEEIRLEALSHINGVKPIIKQLFRVINHKAIVFQLKNPGGNHTRYLPTKYEYPRDNAIHIHNMLKAIELVGLDENGLTIDLIKKIATNQEFID